MLGANLPSTTSTQYHAILILLHRPFIQYDDGSQDEDADAIHERGGPSSHFTALSRSICVEGARRIALVLQQYRETLNLSQVFETGLQHAGAATTALMGEIAMLELADTSAAVTAREELVSLLQSLRLSISLMSGNYEAATRMTTDVDRFIGRIGSSVVIRNANRPRDGRRREGKYDTTADDSCQEAAGLGQDRRKRARRVGLAQASGAVDGAALSDLDEQLEVCIPWEP